MTTDIVSIYHLQSKLNLKKYGMVTAYRGTVLVLINTAVPYRYA